MNPKFRLPLTATPIKNRLPDVFRLAHWSTGAHHSAHPRFPFSDEDRETFADEFSVSERNLSAEARSESKRRFVKLTPQVCNIHRLWKLLRPIILRRRKEECGEDLVAMQRNVVRVPMGTEQAKVYKFHLDAKYLDINGRPAMGARLQALRIAAANPASFLLTRPDSDCETKGEPRSNHAYVPKLASALALIKDILQRCQQVVIFSAFHDSLDALSAHLHEAGVEHLVLDGRMSPTKRGAAAAQFKKGPAGGIPVLLAGVEAMSEGHSFNLCSNVILMAYSWAFDKFLQAINRIWRLNSIADVNVYPIICSGSIDRTLEANIQEKRDAAELVLDGHLLGENPQEVNLAELLRIAEKEFTQMSAAGTIDERELEKEWPALRSQLAKTAQSWKSSPNIACRNPGATRKMRPSVR
jgi:SNF2 family DNA or RNA helicase